MQGCPAYAKGSFSCSKGHWGRHASPRPEGVIGYLKKPRERDKHKYSVEVKVCGT